jgi:ABC-type antimicrobial peptide transport system permease subunit
MTIVRLTLRGLAAHKLRLGLTAFAVILGVAFVSGTMIFSATMDSAVTSGFAELGKGTDAVVRPTKTLGAELGEDDDRPVPASLVAAVEGASGVAKVHAAATGFAGVLDKNGNLAGDPPQTGTDWTDDPDFSLARLQSGTGPRTANEIAIDESTAKAAGYRVGDQVQVALLSGTRTFTLVGIFQYGPPGSPPLAITAFEPTAARQLLMEKPDTYRQLAVRADDGVSQTQLRDAVAAVLPAGYEAITGQQAIDERAKSVKDILDLLSRFVLAFAILSIFVGSFIIFNTFTMLVAQRTRELALLRAVGASRSQTTRLVIGEATGVALLGSTLGLGLGVVLAVVLRKVFSMVGNDLPAGELTVPTSAAIWSYAVGMTVTLVAAYLPARRAARIPPVAALRDDVALPSRSLRFMAVSGSLLLAGGVAMMIAGFSTSGSTSLYLAGGGAAVAFIGIAVLNPIVSKPMTRVIGWPLERIFGTVGKLSRGNAQRNPRRTAATASALMIGLTLIGGVSVIAESIVSSVDHQLDTGLVADYRVTTKSITGELGEPTREAVANTPGVANAVAVSSARIRLDGKVRTVTAGDGQDLATLFRLTVRDGTSTLGENELLVSNATATSEGWRVGETVPVEYQDGTKANMRIAGIYADVKEALETVPPMILGTASYRAHYGNLINEIDVIARPGTDTQALNTALAATLAPWPNLDLKDREAIKDQYTSQIDILLQLVLVLLALSVVIAALGIVNTLALSVIERTREIGLLRAVGMQRAQLRQMVRYEAVIISVFGAVLGLGIGVTFAVVVQNIASKEGIEVLSIPVVRLGLFLLVAAVIGVIAAIWPARRASRMDILRAIATE